MLKALLWAHEKREYNNPCEGAKRDVRGRGSGRTPSTGNQREWSYSHFVLGNKCCLSFRGSCNCMPHMLSYMRLYNAHNTTPHPPTASARPLLPPMLNANAELNPSTRRHNNKKRFTRLNVGKLTTRSVSGFTEEHNTHTPTHTHPHLHTQTHKSHNIPKHTKAKRFLLCSVWSFDWYILHWVFWRT